jgi:hypothetical protein
VVLISDIEATTNQLVCTTELSGCCATVPNRFGDWYYPNGSIVRRDGDGDSFYRTRRAAVTVPGGETVLGGALLHRRHGAMSPTGIYSCVIRDANGMDQTLYVGLYTSTNNGSAHNERSVVHF